MMRLRFCWVAAFTGTTIIMTGLLMTGCVQDPGAAPEVASTSRPLSSSYVVNGPVDANYSSLSNGTILWEAISTDFVDVYRDVPIGFSFDFYDRSYSSVRVSSNGILTFGDTGTSAWSDNVAIPGAAVPQAFIAPWWDHLKLMANSGGADDKVWYEVTGTAPNRVFAVEWYSTSNFGNIPDTLTSYLYFKVLLFETTNVIELWYRDGNAIDGSPPDNSASAGIENRTGMSGYTALACSPNCTRSDFNLYYGYYVRFTPSIEPSVARAGHAATLMTDGTVLVTGGAVSPTAEIYSVRSPGWSLTGDMGFPRSDHSGTVLLDGNAFIAGGRDNAGLTLKSTEIYNRAGRTFKPGPLLKEAREGHTATLLQDGRVFLAGGLHDGTSYLKTAEIYDPANGTMTTVGTEMPDARAYHTATLLSDGRVFIAGGYDGTNSLDTAVIFEPKTGIFIPAINKMAKGRRSHTATLLLDGSVLVAGGRDNAGALNSSESYSLLLSVWSTRGNLNGARFLHSATLLLDGTVFVTGGLNGNTPLNTIETFSTNTGLGTWTLGAPLLDARYRHTATMLPSARVLVYGGIGASGLPLKTAEVIASAVSSPSALLRPGIITAPATAAPGDTLKITGLGLRGVTEGSSGGTQSSPADVPNATLVPQVNPGPPTYLAVHDFNSTALNADVPCATPFGAQNLRIITDGVASEPRALNVDGVTQGTACKCDEACAMHPPNTVCYLNTGSCATGQCAYTPRRQGYLCNDNEICTSADQCDGAGTCAGTPYTCTPNQCQTSSTCDGNGGCTVVNKGAGTGCNDNDACTSADHCDGAGHCIGNPMVCNSPPPAFCFDGVTSRVYNQQGTCSGGNCNYTYNDDDCRPGTCNGATGRCNSGDPCQDVICDTPPNSQCYTSPGTCNLGSCSYPQNFGSCDDGNPCTQNDTCNAAGNCAGLPVPPGGQCDDGNTCTRNDRCDQNGVCVGTSYTCPAPGECQQSVTCDGFGGCNTTNKADTAACTADAFSCTADHCDGFGACIHTANPGFCLITGSCVAAGTRQSGEQCKGCDPAVTPYDWGNLDASTVCDDLMPCTANDHCDGAGVCGGTSYNCPAPNQCQQSVTCDGKGGCAIVYKSQTATCDDGNPCSSADHCDGAGNCAGTPYACTPGECEATSICNGTGGCTATPKTLGTTCDDSNECTSADQCDGQGKCAGTAFACPAPTECQTSVTCDGAGGCTTVNKAQGEACTADGLDCTSDQCDGAGACVHVLASGHCVIDGVCYAGGEVDGQNSCHVCDSSLSTDAWTVKAQGEPCDDQDLCTRDDECSGVGVCAGTAFTCPTPTECQEPDVCDGLGGCNAVDKPEGTACTADSDPCTKDECKAGECVHTDLPRGAPCDDGDPCTENDKCDSQGVCAGTATANCQPDGGTPDGMVGDGGATDGGGTTDGGKADAGAGDAGHPADGGKPGDAGAVGDGSLEKPDTGGVPGENTDLSAVGGGCSCATVVL